MRKYQYKVIDTREKESGWYEQETFHQVEKYLNHLGDQGWELINLDFQELEGRHALIGVAKREMR